MVIRDLRKYGTQSLMDKEDRLMCLLLKTPGIKVFYGGCDLFDCVYQGCFVEKIYFDGVERPINGLGIIWRFHSNLKIVWFDEAEGHEWHGLKSRRYGDSRSAMKRQCSTWFGKTPFIDVYFAV